MDWNSRSWEFGCLGLGATLRRRTRTQTAASPDYSPQLPLGSNPAFICLTKEAKDPSVAHVTVIGATTSFLLAKRGFVIDLKQVTCRLVFALLQQQNFTVVVRARGRRSDRPGSTNLAEACGGSFAPRFPKRSSEAQDLEPRTEVNWANVPKSQLANR